MGNKPARTSEDLPAPLRPTTSAKGRPGGAAAQQVEQLRHRLGPTAEDQRVVDIERLQPSEWRALPLRFPERGRRGHARFLQLLADPSPQMRLEKLLESRGMIELVERRLERAAFAAEPLVEETVQRIALAPLHQLDVAAADGHRDIRHFAVDEDVRRAAGAAACHRVLELELRAREVSRAVRPGRDGGRKRRPEPGPQDENAGIGLRGPGDLRLERLIGTKQLIFPEDRVQPHETPEFELNSRDHGAAHTALVADVMRRRNENPEIDHTAPGLTATPPSPSALCHSRSGAYVHHTGAAGRAQLRADLWTA